MQQPNRRVARWAPIVCLSLAATPPAVAAWPAGGVTGAIPPSSGCASEAAVRSLFLDLDGDGRRDMLVQHADGSLSVHLYAAPRSFVEVLQELPRTELTDALATDLDGDGQVDLYLVTPTADRALLGDGDGRFHDATRELGLVEHGVGIAAERVDLDLDGRPELVVHNHGSDVLFWAEGDGRFVREALSPSSPLDSAPTEPVQGASVARAVPNELDHGGALGAKPGARAGAAIPGGPQGRLALAPSTTGAPAATAAPATSFQSFFDPRYVNDDAGEVDSADIADGSLTGADVSTQSGDVTFAGAVLTARQGVFGVASLTNGSGSTISGGSNNATTGQFSVISGGFVNDAQGDYSAIGGGRFNIVQGDSGTVAGGEFNSAGYAHSVVGGGLGNIAMSPLTVIGGGESNLAAYTYATIGGGRGNRTNNDYSTVCGGQDNEAGGAWSSVMGGYANAASGDFSAVGGHAAQAMHAGAFVWGDSTSDFKASSADDQFNVYADGGVRMFAEGSTTPSFEVSDAGKVRIADGTEGLDRVLTSDANGEASWGPRISSGTYTPTWTNLEGITGAPFTIEAHYTRVGDMVTVLVVNNFPTFAIGTNRATITLPPGLPVASGFPESFLVSGSFTNDWYRHGSEQNCGAVVHEDSTHVRLVLMNATQSGGATAFCNFTYLTDAP